jgi:hypothetical protein
MLVDCDCSSKLDVWSSALRDAAAIVEAEWLRLGPSRGPFQDVACERPAPRRRVPLPRTVVTTMPRPRTRSAHPSELRLQWPVSNVWARERSPPRS